MTDAVEFTDGALVIDMGAWRSGEPGECEAIGAAVDANLRADGFLLVRNHGIDDAVIADLKTAVERFFTLDPSVKQRYETAVGGVGWMPPGVEANSYASGVPSPPDLKETFRALHPAWDDDPVTDHENRWPAEVPELRDSMLAYMERLWRLAVDLYEIFGVALGLGRDTVAQHACAPVSSLNINRYPPRTETGAVEQGQFRIGAHSDFGVLTILHRERGRGGLQVELADGSWADAPFAPGTVAVNIGDMMAHWTGGLWKATVHRVLPPPDDAPDEELTSLVGFCGVRPDTLLETFRLPGSVTQDPVFAGDYMARKLSEIDLA